MKQPLKIVEKFVTRVYPCPQTTEIFIDSAMHVLIIIIALSVIFKKVITKAETDALEGEIEHAMDTATSSMRESITDWSDKVNDTNCLMRSTMYTSFSAVKRFEDQDTNNITHTETEMANRALLNRNATIVTIVAIVFIMMVFMVAAFRANNSIFRKQFGGEAASHGQCKSHGIDWKQIFLRNTTVLGLVVLSFEVFFITQVALHYVPTKASSVANTAINRAKQQVITPTNMPPVLRGPSKNSTVALKLGGAVSLATVAMVAISKSHQSIDSATPPGNKIWGKVDEVFRHWGVPVIGAMAVALAVTGVYFTEAKNTEGRLVERQVQRVVDKAFSTYRTGISALPSSQADSIDASTKKKVNALEMPDMTDAQKEIDERNSPIEKKVKVICIIIVVAALVLIGMGSSISAYSAKSSGASPAKAAGRFALLGGSTLVLGATLAFIAEYSFLEFVISRFEAADPTKITNRQSKMLIDSINLDPRGCKDAILQRIDAD